MNTAQVRQLVVAAILGKTDAENRVYSPRDWPTTEEMYPVILVQTPIEEKQSLGRNAPQFNTITTVRIT
ncbi:ATP-binding protein, partial [Yersinia enterocolitica]|nr:ATP-binding protein [Yersinia enterocolitica]